MRASTFTCCLAALLLILAPSVQAGPFLTPEVATLPNGITVVTQAWQGDGLEEEALVMLAFRGGTVEEEARLRGLTHWLAQTLARVIQDTLAMPGETGNQVAAELDAEYAAVAIRAKQSRLESAWPLVVDILTDPEQGWVRYAPDPEEEAIQLAALQSDGLFMTDLLLRTHLLEGSPYVNPLVGTPATWTAFGEGDLKNWAQRMVHPSRMIITVVSPDGYRTSTLTEPFGAWKPAHDTEPVLDFGIPRVSHETQSLKPRIGTTPTISLGFSGPSVRDADLPAFLVVAAALGDRASGRFAALRGQGRGQALTTDWVVERHRQGSLASFQFAMDATGDIFALHTRLVEILEQVAAEGLTEAEVARAQGGLQAMLGGQDTDPASMASWLTQWTVWESIQTGRRFEGKIGAVTLAEANAALGNYYRRDQSVTVGLAANLPDDYYFPNPDDVHWGTFIHPSDRGHFRGPEPLVDPDP